MKNIQWIFLFFAVAAAASIIGIGIFIAEQSLAGIIICIILLFAIMGTGFKLKRKRREEGRL
ncbi:MULTISPECIES: YlaF family protein [Bacillus]|jgi:predicted membrane channel-forming protein YqfA (hemolysin III family)|uniref:YlaF family protein n=1 Tax=Bacillus smithii 7_3_47FAA TaxID=665952 RepID=G9QMC5_9BACI|nr:YlaF family protein [Bacillus smithii]AKP46710.1 hypothetical protein BSM4216_1429 [Bacillus smithii]EHL77170.1 hypothetical protein HMPREF1015_00692 [Bacillus smithii 7_3_47FAA]MED4883622.1 YlaF family protein [Bacillus smithii]MED4927930.1 YlaF family protein [Bacillus smithii]